MMTTTIVTYVQNVRNEQENAIMLETMDTPMVVFCEDKWVDGIQKIRKNKSTRVYPVPIAEVRSFSSFVTMALILNPFNTDFFMWCDIDYFKDRNVCARYKQIPSKKVVDGMRKDKIYVLNAIPFRRNELSLQDGFVSSSINKISTSMIIGYKDVWENFCVYYDLLADKLERENKVVIVTTMCVLYPELMILVSPPISVAIPERRWNYMKDFLNS